jgi:hypothetical protein
MRPLARGATQTDDPDTRGVAVNADPNGTDHTMDPVLALTAFM